MKLLFERIERSQIGYRLAKGVFWSIAGTLISRGLTMVAMLFVARILGKSAFGELGIIESSLGMFGTFAGFGLAVTAAKFIAEYRINNPERAGRILGLSGLTAIITGGFFSISLFIFAPWLTSHTLNAPHLQNVFKIGAIMILLNAMNGAQVGALSGFEAFKALARINLYCGLLSFPILICGAYFGGLAGTVWAQTINLSINWLLNHVALRKEARSYNIPIKLNSCTQELSVLWKFSLPAVLGYIMVGPVNWACNAMLVNQPNGYSEMGIFNATNQWYITLMFIPRLLNNVMLPVLSERISCNESVQSQNALILAMKISAIVTFPVILLASIASPFILALYGDGFRQGWPTFIVVLFTTGLEILITPVGASLAASGKMWVAFRWNICWAISFLLGTVALIYMGALGLATAKLLSYIVLTAWIIGYVAKQSRFEKANNNYA